MSADDVCNSQQNDAKPPPVAETIRAKQLEICDDQGRCVIRLGSVDGAPFAFFYDAAGQERLSLVLNHHFHPNIGMFGPDGDLKVGMGVNDEMGTGINILDATHLRLHAGVTPDGRVHLRTFGEGVKVDLPPKEPPPSPPQVGVKRRVDHD